MENLFNLLSVSYLSDRRLHLRVRMHQKWTPEKLSVSYLSDRRLHPHLPERATAAFQARPPITSLRNSAFALKPASFAAQPECTAITLTSPLHCLA